MGSECSTGIAIIAAAGHGRRFGGKKQFLEINGKPVYYYSVEAYKPFAEHIYLVVPKEDTDSIEPYGTKVLAGGAKRYDSIYEAISAIDREISPDRDTVIMIHDGARPLVDADTIRRTLKDAVTDRAAVATVAVTDTIRTVDGSLIDRNELRAMQTPQAFKWEIIKTAYEKFMSLPQNVRDDMHVTDDVEIVYRMLGIRSRMSEGNPGNIKITTPEDIKKLNI